MCNSSVQLATLSQQTYEGKELSLPTRGEESYTSPLQSLGIRLVKEFNQTTAHLPKNWTIRNISEFDIDRASRDVFLMKDDKGTPRVVCRIFNMFMNPKLEILVLDPKQQQYDERLLFRLFYTSF
jgi:hypothetical protein